MSTKIQIIHADFRPYGEEEDLDREIILQSYDILHLPDSIKQEVLRALLEPDNSKIFEPLLERIGYANIEKIKEAKGIKFSEVDKLYISLNPHYFEELNDKNIDHLDNNQLLLARVSPSEEIARKIIEIKTKKEFKKSAIIKKKEDRKIKAAQKLLQSKGLLK